MRFPFNERKTAQAAAHLITLNQGQINTTLLPSLLFLTDRITLARHGKPLTGSKIMAMPIGPILTDVLHLLNEPNPQKNPWHELISPPENNEIHLLSTNIFPVDELSRFELRTLENILLEHGGKSPNTLTAWLRINIPEWTYPQRGLSTIEPEDVLRAQGVLEPVIQYYQEDADTLWALHNLGLG